MRILAVGHTYVSTFAQSKYFWLTKLASDVSLQVLVPPRTPEKRDVLMRYQADHLDGLHVVTIPARLDDSHMTYHFDQASLAEFLAAFRPDHVHIEEDPHSFVGVQVVRAVKRMLPGTTVSFFIWDNLARRRGFPIGMLKRHLANYSFRRCDHIVCGNAEAQQLLGRKGYFGPSSILPQIGIEPHDYEDSRDAATRALLCGSSPDNVVIGYFGRMIPSKGVIELLTALEQIGDLPWRCVLLGNGSLDAKLRGEWQHRLGDRLLILDAVPHSAVAKFMKCLDLFVLNSRTTPQWKEQFGLVLAQAMAAGVACVGSSSGAIPEVIGEAGVIVPEDDGAAMRETLRRLIRLRSCREDLGRRGLNRAMALYTNEHIAERYVELFRNIRARDDLADIALSQAAAVHPSVHS